MGVASREGRERGATGRHEYTAQAGPGEGLSGISGRQPYQATAEPSERGSEVAA
jgi:hypothetical protein